MQLDAAPLTSIVFRDGVVFNRRRRAYDRDSGKGAMRNGESPQYRPGAFILEHKYGRLKTLAIERCDRCAASAGNRDGLALEIDLLKISSRSHQNGVSILRQLHCLFDGWNFGGDVERSWTSHSERGGYRSRGWFPAQEIRHKARKM